MVVQL